jgi:hypothetical protein
MKRDNCCFKKRMARMQKRETNTFTAFQPYSKIFRACLFPKFIF